ncbi:MAG: ABC transporter ATP-binding protein [Thermodesulfobacteriota bacterium]
MENISKTFDEGTTFAVHELSLEVARGETFVLLGSSGCGKTTTLKMLNRLLEPSSGRIWINGHDIRKDDPVELRRSIGYVFQDVGLFPHMDVESNISVVLRLKGEDPASRRRRACELLELVGLDPKNFANRYPAELSGGQQQRIGVARALAASPDILLMDEPFGALDALTRDSLQQELLRIRTDVPTTIMFVTHDIFEALLLGERIGIMHQGTMHQIGHREEILRQPATDFVRDLFESPRRHMQRLTAQLNA